MNKFVTEGIVLKNTNYSDSHKFFTILTKDHGKISALAMGVRKISSRRAGNLDSISHVLVSITENSKGFRTIEEVRSIDSFKELKVDLEKMYIAFRFADTIDASVEPDQDSFSVFSLLITALNHLRNLSLSNDYVNIWFLINLGNLLGFKLDVANCASCGNFLEQETIGYVYSQEAGGFLCDRCLGYSNPSYPGLLAKFQQLYSPDIVLSEMRLSDSELVQIKRILDIHSKNYYVSPKNLDFLERN